jgi:hypothetical protein
LSSEASDSCCPLSGSRNALVDRYHFVKRLARDLAVARGEADEDAASVRRIGRAPPAPAPLSIQWTVHGHEKVALAQRS